AVGPVYIRAGAIAAGQDAAYKLLHVAAIFLTVTVEIAGAIADLRDRPEPAGEFERPTGHESSGRSGVGLADGGSEFEAPCSDERGSAAIERTPRQVEIAARLGPDGRRKGTDEYRERPKHYTFYCCQSL